MLTALTAFVVDYGVLWVARRQAQNAADAGALAGATALAFDDVNYPPTTTIPLNSAKLAALCASRPSSSLLQPASAAAARSSPRSNWFASRACKA
jgi:uncharacterized membrane protein